jgi:hypothetical protein
MRRAGEDHRQQPAYPANEESGCQEVDEEQFAVHVAWAAPGHEHLLRTVVVSEPAAKG